MPASLLQSANNDSDNRCDFKTVNPANLQIASSAFPESQQATPAECGLRVLINASTHPIRTHLERCDFKTNYARYASRQERSDESDRNGPELLAG
jgi:hypothetical protein